MKKDYKNASLDEMIDMLEDIDEADFELDEDMDEALLVEDEESEETGEKLMSEEDLKIESLKIATNIAKLMSDVTTEDIVSIAEKVAGFIRNHEIGSNDNASTESNDNASEEKAEDVTDDVADVEDFDMPEIEDEERTSDAGEDSEEKEDKE